MTRVLLALLTVLIVLVGCQEATVPTPQPTPQPGPQPGPQPDPYAEPEVASKGNMSTNYSDAALAVVSNAENEVFVAGVQARDFAKGISTPYGQKLGGQLGPLRLFLNRYSQGAEQLTWSQLIDVGCPYGVTCYLRAVELGLDATNESFLLSEEVRETVDEQNLSTWTSRAYIDKLSPDGQVVWRKAFDEAVNSRALGLSVAADGTSYVLWQALNDNPLDLGTENIKEGAYLGTRLTKLDTAGAALWTRKISAPLSFDFQWNIADVALLGEQIIVANFDGAQAFDSAGKRLWKKDIASDTPPSESEDPDQGKTYFYFTRVELVTSGTRIYLGRGSERLLPLFAADQQKLEVVSLSSTGEELWRKILGDEQNNIQGPRLSASSLGGAEVLYVLGLDYIEGGSSGPTYDNFLSVFDAEGNAVEMEDKIPDDPFVTFFGIQSPKREGADPYIVGTKGESSSNYDTPDSTAADAFLMTGQVIQH